MSKKVTNALIWLKCILEEHQIPFQIVGGFAATIHGGSRPVADIDLYIPKNLVNKILPYVNNYISKPLAHYVEYGWDLEYLQLIYQEQKIEIGLSPGTKVLNTSNGEWCELSINYNQSIFGSYSDIIVPTMPISQLIEYKSFLGREVDLIDISELSKKHYKSLHD